MRKDVKRSRNGFTIIELLIVTTVIAILASIALPNYRTSQKSANEASAIVSMRALVSAEEEYRLKQSPPAYGVLSQLKTAGVVNPTLGSGSKSGYTFLTFGVPGTSSYAFTGVPQTDRGDRYFYVDQSGIVRVNRDAAATPSSPPIE